MPEEEEEEEEEEVELEKEEDTAGEMMISLQTVYIQRGHEHTRTGN